MESAWVDRDAAALIDRCAKDGVPAELALRVYTTRLLGSDPKLVLHGGGNTSVKTRVRDLLGEDVEVLCVKGSGWDMARLEPAGLPAVRLDPLKTLRSREALSDEDMVRIQRALLIDPMAPNPSVETLLHAFYMNEGILVTPFHTMFLMCPATARQKASLGSSSTALAAERLAFSMSPAGSIERPSPIHRLNHHAR